ncbi:MAG: HNH endonuclease [Gammaproteobacteria bacterium]|nr:HNH endonuclease [Gammaproteobacteria bacterium]MYD20275.1 HNH endonuclease [Rhodothermaceae bacterium]MYG11374.1 HNH endonuclease [Gammaproteobacteria bacterium]MYK28891.1 HNH endonuclease [Gammaproteobacteria bacterium]
MRVCAICRAPSVQYSVEHVIPEALGGYYVLRDLVCVDCNSRLGDRVDSALVNHWLTKLYRFVHGLRGKAKSVPNPFAGHFTMQADSSKRMQVRLNRDGRLVPYILPQVTHTDLDDKRVEVNVSVDATDEAKLDTIVSKIAKRMGVSPDQFLANAQRVKVSDNSGLKGPRTIDLRDFKLGLLKIAYEFAVDRVPSYFESDDAKDAAELLREARFSDVEQYVNIGDGFDHSILAPFGDFLAFGDQKHYLVLFGTDSSLLCFVHLHNLFTVGVTLSTRSFGDFLRFGVNDIASRTFKVWTLEDLPVAVRYRPQLRFDTAQAAVAFQQAEADADFDYEREDGSWRLFQRDGTYLGLRVHDLVEHLAPVQSGMHQGRLIDEYWLPEGIYLRQRGSTRQVEVCALRAEHTWEKL